MRIRLRSLAERRKMRRHHYFAFPYQRRGYFGRRLWVEDPSVHRTIEHDVLVHLTSRHRYQENWYSVRRKAGLVNDLVMQCNS